MNLFINRRAILARWQSQTERATEADAQPDGEIAPLLHLGPVQDALIGLHGLHALHAFAAARRDLAAPTALAGGDSGTWLLALAAQRDVSPLRGIDAAVDNDAAVDDVQPPLPLHVVYGGVDRATYAASSEDALAWQIAPAQQPGAALAWSALPFVPTDWIRADSLQAEARWTAWLGVALALLLLLAALIV